MLRKRILIVSLVVMSLVGFVFSAASQAEGLGVVQMDKILSEYNKAQKAQKDIIKKEQAFKEKIAAKEAELKEMVGDRAKLQEVRDKYLAELEKEGQQLAEYKKRQMLALRDDILKAIRKVAKEYALTMVVDKQVAYYGGLDITDWVIKELN
jgi:outer membrane protein